MFSRLSPLPSRLLHRHTLRPLSTSKSSSSSFSPILFLSFTAVAGGVMYAANNLDKLGPPKIPGTANVTVAPSSLSQPQASLTDRAYFVVEYGSSRNNLKKGRINIGLYGDEAPRTVSNFKALCTTGVPKPTSGMRYAGVPFNEDQGPTRSYKNTPMHRIIPGFMIQGGDVTLGNGMGGASKYGECFEDEYFGYYHRGGGVLSMANRGPNTGSSQFFITLDDAKWLDGKHVVFGVVEDEESWKVCKEIENLGSRSGDVKGRVQIVESGLR